MIIGKEGSLYYQVIYKRVIRQVLTEYKIFTDEWNSDKECLTLSTVDMKRYDYLSLIQQNIEWDNRRFQHIIQRLSSSNRQFNTDTVVQEFQNKSSDITLFNRMQKTISKLWKQGQYRTSETYTATLNSFREFRNGKDLYFEDMDSDLLLSYEYYLKAKSLSPNTISFYMKRLRAVYNKAVDDGFAENKNPFKRVFTSSEKTVKRAIPVKYIRKLKDLDLSHSISKSFARDMFLFSFYTRGMSFIDMAIPPAHHHTRRRQRTQAVPEYDEENKQAAERHRAFGRSACSLVNVLHPAQLGYYRPWQGHSAGSHQ